MTRIRKYDTIPEMIVRRITHGLGYRYRLHDRRLPGTPDLSFPALRKVILVHGCFWHQHDCRLGRKKPTSNTNYWHPKLSRNVARDEDVHLQLARLGWDVLVIWECETRDAVGLARRISSFLAGARAVGPEAYQVVAEQYDQS
jgi:DNA mismatch endonuclease (patch repair protein)